MLVDVMVVTEVTSTVDVDKTVVAGKVAVVVVTNAVEMDVSVSVLVLISTSIDVMVEV